MTRSAIASVISAVALTLTSSPAAWAQSAPSAQARPESADNAPRTERVLPGRTGRAQIRDTRGRGRAPAQPTPEENKAAAQALVQSAGLACDIGQSNRLGTDAEQHALYEVTCATGPGYILIASTPVQAFDCIELKGQAEQARARDATVDVGQQCVIPQNLDTVAVVRGYAVAAGQTCSIDQAAVRGKSSAGNLVYEAGCSSAPGFWLERLNTGWEVTECLQVVATGAQCNFTTMEEEAAAFQPKLASTEASDCQVQQVRLMGQNANGRFFEAKCSAGDGYIARVKDGVTQQVYACATAQQIGGGCTLTPAPAAATAPASGGRP